MNKLLLRAAFIFLICHSSFVNSHAQATQYLFDGATGGSYDKIIKLSDGNLLLSGSSTNVIKLNGTTMQPIWQVRIDLPYLNLYQLTESTDGTYLVLGGIYDSNAVYHVYVARLGSSGNIIFSKLYHTTDGNLISHCIANSVTADTGFVFIGGNCAYSTFVVKCSYMGNIQWQYQYSVTASGSAMRNPITTLVENNQYTFFGQGSVFSTVGFVAGKIDSLGNSSSWTLSGFPDSLLLYPQMGKFIKLSNGSYFYFIRNQVSPASSYIGLIDTAFHSSTIYGISHPTHIVAADLLQLASSDILVTAFTDTVDSNPAQYGAYLHVTTECTLNDCIFSYFFPPTNSFFHPYGYANAAVQLGNGKVVTSAGTFDNSGITLTNDSMSGLCHDTLIPSVTLVPLVNPASTVYPVTRNNTHIYSTDTLGVIKNTSTFYVDSCGGFKATDITNLPLTTPNFQLYPNPASNTVTITADESLIGATITMTDITGRKVAAVPLLTAHCLPPTDNFANGIYFITLTNPSGASATKKLIIQK